jgi:hypothetical protein
VDIDVPQVNEEYHASAVLTRRGSTTPIEATRIPFVIEGGCLRDDFDDSKRNLSAALKSGLTPEAFAARALSYEQAKANALQAKTVTETALSAARDEAAKALGAFQKAQREAIPYPRIFVTPSAETIFVSRTIGEEIRVQFDVQLRSSDPDSRLDVYRDGKLVKQETMHHPAGMINGHLSCSLQGAYGSGGFSFKYFSGAGTDLKQVDHAEAWYNLGERPDRAAGVDPQPALEKWETGRLAENPLPYDLKVVRFEGPNAILRFSSPANQSTIAASTGGIYSKVEQSHEGGMASGIALVTVSPDKSGRYSFGLFDHGVERDRIEVNWDASTRKLSLVNPADHWSVDTEPIPAQSATINPSLPLSDRIAQLLVHDATAERELERINTLLRQQTALTTLNVSDTNQQLAAQQGLTLYRNSPLFVSVSQVHEAVYRQHPEWRPENLEATVTKLWDASGRLVSRGNIKSSLIRGIQDAMGGYDQDLALYEQFMAEITKKGVETCMGVRQGLPQNPLTRSLYDLIESRKQYVAIGRLSNIGIKLPDADRVIEAGKALYQTHVDYLMQVQADNACLIRNDLERASNREWQETQGRSADISVLTRVPAANASKAETDAHEARRIERARQLVSQAMGGSDPRAKLVVAVRDDANIQRARQLADGGTEVAITTLEAKQIAAKTEEEIRKNDGDARNTVNQLVTSKELVAMVGRLEAGLELAQRQQNIEAYLTAHASEVQAEFVDSFIANGKSPNDATQAFQWLSSHTNEVAAYQGLYLQTNSPADLFASLSKKMAAGIVSIRSELVEPATGQGSTVVSGEPMKVEYLHHAIDLTTPGIQIIGHPVGGDQSPFWHSSLLLVPEHPERFANLGLKDEAGNPIFANGQGWVTLGISGEFGFNPTSLTFGKEVSDYNRSFDDPVHMPNTLLAEITAPQGISIDDLIEKIIRADMRYKDDANYDMFPGLIQGKSTPGYNCNSFTTAMLQEIGIQPPAIDKFRIFPAYGEVPLPIPQ